MDGTNKRRIAPTWLLLSLIILLALALRVFQLGRQSLWYDEGVSAYMTRLSLAEMMRWTAHDIQPPLYYLILRLWASLFGDGEFSLRFPSLVFGLLTVPLIYMVGKRLFDRIAGLAAAALAALSPLYLWYSQEARMYTLLTFLCLLSSYLLLLITDERLSQERRRILWLGLTLAHVLAVYTHYFAFSVIAFQIVYFLAWWLGRARERALLIEGGLALVGLLLAYVPWLPFIFTRYGADVSYWKGTLKLNEALRKLPISFGVGETVIEATAWKIAIGYMIVSIVSLIAIGLRTKDQGPKTDSILFLLLYLLLPTALIMAFIYRHPKFSPRYLMLASPPFLLIIAAGLVSLFQRAVRAIRGQRTALLLTAYCCLLFTLITMAYADYNNYFDIRFTKADFRGMVRYIKDHIKPDETIILTSGHMYPVFTCYYEGENWHPIPPQRTLSTVNTLNYGVAEDLNRALTGAKGVWVVLWQDEVVDPNGFLTAMLDEKCELLPIEASFYHVRLRHYIVPPGTRFSPEPDIEHPLEVNFGGKIDLLGYSQPQPQTVTLYWRARQTLEEDYKVSLRLRDGKGHYWHRRDCDRRPAADLYPTTRWKPGEVLFSRYDLPALPGTPPGEYQLEVVLYAEPEALDVFDTSGAFQGKSAFIGVVALARNQPATVEDLGVRQPLEAGFGGRIALLGQEIGGTKAQPGDTLYLMLFWQALSDIGEDYTLLLRLVDEAGGRVGEQAFPPASASYPTSRWAMGEMVRGQYDFSLPFEAAPGPAHLEVDLVDNKGRPLGETVILTDLEIETTERVFVAPETPYPSGANFNGLMTLVGADLDATVVEPGGALHLTLYWRAKTRMEKSYTVFTHLLDAGNRIRAQQDSVPVHGARPTTGWVPGEVIRDDYELIVEADAPSGDYIIEVGLYDANDPTFARLPVLDEAGQIIEDKVIIVSGIQVKPSQ